MYLTVLPPLISSNSKNQYSLTQDQILQDVLWYKLSDWMMVNTWWCCSTTSGKPAEWRISSSNVINMALTGQTAPRCSDESQPAADDCLCFWSAAGHTSRFTSRIWSDVRSGFTSATPESQRWKQLSTVTEILYLRLRWWSISTSMFCHFILLFWRIYYLFLLHSTFWQLQLQIRFRFTPCKASDYSEVCPFTMDKFSF